MKVHPIHVIICGLLICSFGFNILQWSSNKRLVYKIQKLEAGTAKGLFLEPKIDKPPISDEKLNELMEKVIEKILRERVV